MPSCQHLLPSVTGGHILSSVSFLPLSSPLVPTRSSNLRGHGCPRPGVWFLTHIKKEWKLLSSSFITASLYVLVLSRTDQQRLGAALHLRHHHPRASQVVLSLLLETSHTSTTQQVRQEEKEGHRGAHTASYPALPPRLLTVSSSTNPSPRHGYFP